MKKVTAIVSATILSIGILGGGFSVGKAVYLARKMNRVMTVKGLAERDVKSDFGIWEINYRELGSDLVQINTQLQHDQELVIAFLKQQGFEDKEIERTQLRIEDRLANLYAQNNSQSSNQPRYVVTSGLRLRSTRVDAIDKAAQQIDKLLQQGVAVSFDAASISPNPSYYFVSLDNIRPSMLSEATSSAKTVAQQFAKDIGSELGGILRANQGVFQVMSRDTSTLSADWGSNQSALGSIDKKVRLVTTIDYQLK